MMNEMLQAQGIEESNSPWGDPVVLVWKKDGSLRFCIDYQRLNAMKRKDVFLSPVSMIFWTSWVASVFSTLDAWFGYWQIQMHKTSREKTTFVTMDGLYEFRAMPYGLCNAPTTFQRLMQKTLPGLGSFCSVYVDDIIVFTSTVEEHLDHLTQVFGRLRKIGLKLLPQKCSF